MVTRPAQNQSNFVPVVEQPTIQAQRAAPQVSRPATLRNRVTSGSPATRGARDVVPTAQIFKLDRALRQALDADPATPVRVIVQTSPGAQASMATWLAREGRQVHHLHSSINGFTATLLAADVAALTTDGSVRRLSIDAAVSASNDVTRGHVLRDTLGLLEGGGIKTGGSSWAADKIGVAVVDSGIEPSKDIHENRIVGFYDFTKNGSSVDPLVVAPYDDYGHGTHVTGLIGGSGDSSSDAYEGAASKAHFVGYKVLNAQGSGYTSDVVAAIDHAIAHKDRHDIRRRPQDAVS